MKNIKSAPNETMEERLNVIRAGVLGSNDGILTVVGVLFSVGAATSNSFTIFIAGIADLFACALSMASGEYASVSSQKDAEEVVVDLETRRLAANPQSVEADIYQFYLQKGVSEMTSRKIAQALMATKPLEAVLTAKYDVQLGHYVSPMGAAISSLICAAMAGVFPLLTMTFVTGENGIVGTILITAIISAMIGLLSAYLGHGFMKRAMLRNVVIALITIAIHYGIGKLF
ncbi:VIT family protein [Weissella diestrammenae]|uniref:VIT family protein n=1 Tax=Weissella diestrammenae TaxID=1162633 RepID=A0A7G9T5V4_9LACO|nr:VIT family protein [Weissella diestrammenae]MCM0582309.1 VIT family protein [Weissella diestrammenae]QNN75479.1 VIT family protein [Weissella diestrammenae]